MKFDTIAIHGGYESDKNSFARAVPIYQTSSYTFKSSQQASDLFSFEQDGNIYTRISNPTTDVLEKRITSLEGGVGTVACSSGQSAVTLACLTLLKQGDEILSSSLIYGGTYALFANTFSRMGIKTKFVNSTNPEDFEKEITENTKLIFTESIANPRLNIADIEKLSQIAHDSGIPLMIDNTVATPYLLKPFDYGADIVVYSATKFLGGHGTSIAGLIVDSGKFNWAGSNKFKEFSEPDSACCGVIFTEKFKEQAFIAKVRAQMLRDIGAAISPFNSFLILQGIETLHLRMQRHCENALKVAEYLKDHKYINWVNYPGLKDNENKDLSLKYLPKGQGALVCFGIKGGKQAGIKFIDNVKLLSHVANIGDAKTLVIHPASTTHQQVPEEKRLLAGISDDFIRLSVGIEDIDDILADIEQALEISQRG